LTLGSGAAVSPTFAAPVETSGKPVITDADRAIVRKRLIEVGGPMWAAIMEMFPAEYDAFETRLLEGAANGTLSNEQARQEGFEFVRGLQERLYDGWMQAPDADLVRINAINIKAAKALKTMDTLACAQFVEGATDADTAGRIGLAGTEILTEVNTEMLTVAKAGRRAQVRRDAITEDEISNVLDAFSASGGNLQWLAGVGSGEVGNLSPAERCDNAILWLEAVQAQPAAIVAKILTAE
jgi:hypothetical protein